MSGKHAYDFDQSLVPSPGSELNGYPILGSFFFSETMDCIRDMWAETEMRTAFSFKGKALLRTRMG